MEALFIFTLSTVIFNTCTARVIYGGSSGYSSSSSSDSSSSIAYIVIPIVFGVLLLVLIPLIICCKLKYSKNRRMGVLPLSTQMVMAQQENQYAPPLYNQASSYNQPQPYGQPPPYEHPPPYPTPSAPNESSRVMSSY
jgi:hypothetical protein